MSENVEDSPKANKPARDFLEMNVRICGSTYDNVRDLLFWLVVPRFIVVKNKILKVPDAIKPIPGECEIYFDPLVTFRRCRLHASATNRPVGTNVFKVNGGCHDLDVVEGELGALCNNFPVHSNHGAAVVVQAVAVAALLVRVQVDSSELTNAVSYAPGEGIYLTLRVASLISSIRV